jgi:nucleoside-diphosphate-sugar epimerase
MKKVIVTGGLGFIGSNLIELLLIHLISIILKNLKTPKIIIF